MKISASGFTRYDDVGPIVAARKAAQASITAAQAVIVLQQSVYGYDIGWKHDLQAAVYGYMNEPFYISLNGNPFSQEPKDLGLTACNSRQGFYETYFYC